VESRTGVSGGEAASLDARSVDDADTVQTVQMQAVTWSPSPLGDPRDERDEHDGVRETGKQEKPGREPAGQETALSPEEPEAEPEPGDSRAGRSGSQPPDLEPEPEPDPRPTPWVARSRRNAAIAMATVAAAAAGIYAATTVGTVHTVLRQSFTQMSSPNIQFYLNGDPFLSGEFLSVPLGILLGGSGQGGYTVHLWTVDGAGKTDSSTAVTVPVQNGAGAVTASVPIPVGAQVLWAQVEGTSLSVHYRFAGSATATASSSP